MPTSIREIARHVKSSLSEASTLRTILKQPDANLRLHVQTAPFSVMCHNMGLMVLPAPYLGTDRSGAISEIVGQIQNLSPDVVGLCEVFANGEREDIFNRLKHIYPYFQEGPDINDSILDPRTFFSDGGLLVLSKHEIIVPSHNIVYTGAVDLDALANKGVIHIRVKPPNSPMAYDIFFTHAQDISVNGGREALYGELSQMNNMIKKCADPNTPTLIMGDINIPAENPGDYRELLNRLRNPVDLWLISGNGETNGCTFVADNNFYGDDGKNPHTNNRLDYVLMISGSRFIPILKRMEVLKLKHQGRFISDHFGLFAQIEDLVQVEF
jgi:endonuclease/exonuclease/phosphatase family metal-dependent hydrolase